jgi:hypothetical protein
MTEKIESTGYVRDELYNESRVDLLHPHAMAILSQNRHEKLVWDYIKGKLDGDDSAHGHLRRICEFFYEQRGTSTFAMELGKICTEGLKKYGAWNWYKGCPNSVWLNHALIHLYANEEDKFLWNIMALYDQELRIREGLLPAELDDIKVPK